MANVLCVGSAVVDITFYLDSFPQEAEKHSAPEAVIMGGGIAANAAVAISRLGGSAILSAQVGDDIIGEQILSDLRSEGVQLRYVTNNKGGKSAFSAVYINAIGDRQIVNFKGKDLRIDPTWLSAKSTFDAVLVDTRIPDASAVALDMANSSGIPGIVDAEAPVSTALLDKASHVAFSQQGIASLYPYMNSAQALELVAATYNVWACVTDGQNDILYTDRNKILTLPTYKLDSVKDTLAAGDVWHGAFALALAEGRQETEAMQFANAVAAYKCTQLGGRLGTPNREQLNTFIMENNS